jgi:serine/threonine protein phosphatase PrpC
MSDNIQKTQIRLTAKTDVGRVREHNEDNYIVCPDVSKKEWVFTDQICEPEEGALLVIADGMGGLNSGEVASAIAVTTIQDYFNDTLKDKLDTHEKVKVALLESIKAIQTNIVNHAKQNPETSGMGTTIVIAFIKDNLLHTAWVGDSRCYVYRKNQELFFATKDHSYVQELVDAGQINMQQAFYHPESNIITRSLGDNANQIAKPDFCSFPLEIGDKILLCSDGLNGMLQDDSILKILHDHEHINEASGVLINAANEAGGHDNITLIVAEVISLSNDPFPNDVKLREMLLAASYHQLDSGNPFKTLKPVEVDKPESPEAEPDISSKVQETTEEPTKKKWILVFIVVSIILIVFLISFFIFYSKKNIQKSTLDIKATITKDSTLKLLKSQGSDFNNEESMRLEKINANENKEKKEQNIKDLKSIINDKKKIEPKETVKENSKPKDSIIKANKNQQQVLNRLKVFDDSKDSTKNPK